MSRHWPFYLLAISFMFSVSFGEVPRRLSYQGLLTTSSGIPVVDGIYKIQFTLYETLEMGQSLWSESHSEISVRNGAFHVVLGSVVALNLRFDRRYYVEVTIQGGPGVSTAEVISPRAELTSSPYSFRSDSARHAEVASPIGVAGGDLTGSYPNPIIGMNAVTSAKILDGSIQSADIGGNQVVKSVNGLRDHLYIAAAGGATVTSRGDSLIINAGSGGGGTGIQGVQNTNSTLDIVNPNGPTATVNLKLPLSGSSSTSATTLTMANLAAGVGILGSSVNSDGIVGRSSSPSKSGIWGDNTGGGYGVAGSTGGGSTAGVWGSNSASGYGVRGTSATGSGVYGESNGSNGMLGINSANGNGVNGIANGSGSGVVGSNTGGTGNGVMGIVSNTAAALYGVNSGNGSAVNGVMSGTGRAGLFQVNNPANNLSGLFATHSGSGNAFAAVNQGTGRAGYFEISNSSSTASALYARTNGPGPALHVEGYHLNGDGAVVLPNNAINSHEMSNEPGVASFGLRDTFEFGTNIARVAELSIRAPTDGFVVLIASGTFRGNHQESVPFSVDVGISDRATEFDPANVQNYWISQTTPSHSFALPVALHAFYHVTEGLHSFHFLARWVWGWENASSPGIMHRRFTAMFFPTAYGLANSGPTGAMPSSIRDDLGQDNSRHETLENTDR